MKKFVKISNVKKSLRGCQLRKEKMENVNGGGLTITPKLCPYSPFNCPYINYPQKCPYNQQCFVVSVYSAPLGLD